jgi:RND family efflux transporter MFP subunit
MRRVVLPGLLLLPALLTACGGSGSSPQEQIAVMQERDNTVTAVTISPVDYEVMISQPGTTYAIRDIELESRVTGYVDTVEFKDGAIVQKGDRLFELDPRPFEAALLEARGSLETAVAARNLAANNVERNRPLVKTGAISQEQFDTFVSDLEQAEGQVEAAAGQLVNAELNLGYATIRAPFTGRLGQRQVEVGDLVQASGSPSLVSLIQYDPMRALVSVPARQLEQLVDLEKAGDIKATVRVNGTRGGGGRVFKGVVDFIDNQVDADTSTVMVRIRFENPDAWAYPGQYSEAEIEVETIPNSVVIPQEALRAEQGGKRFVWLIDDKDKISRQDVSVGEIRDGKARITKGLRGGQRIVVLGSTDLQTGDKISIVTNPADVGSDDSSSSAGDKNAKPSTKTTPAASTTTNGK